MNTKEQRPRVWAARRFVRPGQRLVLAAACLAPTACIVARMTAAGRTSGTADTATLGSLS
jgi:hypothetical protein